MDYERNRVVAFAGFAGSGKTTCAEALIEKGWVHVKIARPMKDMLRAYLKEGCGLPSEMVEQMIEGKLKREPTRYLAGKTPTYAMQTLGGEWGRELMAPHLWLGPLEETICEVFDNGLNVVIDDVRYENEVLFLKANAGRANANSRVFWVNRPDLERGEHHNHMSETRLETPETLQNDSTLGQLRSFVHNYIHEVPF